MPYRYELFESLCACNAGVDMKIKISLPKKET